MAQVETLAGKPVEDTDREKFAEIVVRDSSPVFEASSKPSFMGSRNLVYLSDFHSKRVALVSGAGYGWMPKHFIEADLAEGRLIQLDTTPNEWTYYPQVMVREGRDLGRAAQLFLDTLGAPLSGLSA